ncbi:MAG TPA: 2-amino-4-hydroxy-6-hydroxymethyldihydropteridine diphosphokinase [Casimicrobiaceae bacterium]|nr:2-amino-4-hydroxy-6-hydroxymethyldihydropteridine diphosphokinase [Casimicrobiaceae bacterium]
MPTVALVGLGSNLAHPRRQIARAIAELARLPRTRVDRVSPNYVTAPIACDDAQPDYVNAVVALRTALAPVSLLKRLQAIERRQGRVRHAASPRNSPRTLDLDLLLYDRRRMHLPHMTVPHPRMHERAFVLRPLLDIAPAIAIPGHGAAQRAIKKVRWQRIARTRRHRQY